MPVISDGWDRVLGSQYNMPYMKRVQDRLREDLAKKLTICPPVKDVFKAFRLTEYGKIRVLIIGQSPYSFKGMADGLAFSSNKITLENSVIFSEIKSSTGQTRTIPELDDWAAQGVMLLNTTLTTVQGTDHSHKNIGWETFTKYAIARINELPRSLVIMLWGKEAIAYKNMLDEGKHLVLKAPHPISDTIKTMEYSFRGCHHFDMCNDKMQSNGSPQIRWGDPIVKPLNSGNREQ